jgi:hypothetical protein
LPIAHSSPLHGIDHLVHSSSHSVFEGQSG